MARFRMPTLRNRPWNTYTSCEMPIAKPRARDRGRIPRVLMNGQAAAYSSFRRIRKRDCNTQVRALAWSCSVCARQKSLLEKIKVQSSSKHRDEACMKLGASQTIVRPLEKVSFLRTAKAP